MKTTVKVVQQGLEKYRGDLLALAIFAGAKRVPAEYVGLDTALGGVIGELLRLGDFGGKGNETAVLYRSVRGAVKRVMLVGLGDKDKFELDSLRQAAGTVVRAAGKLGAVRVGLALHKVLGQATEEIDLEEAGQAIGEGVLVGRYEFNEYVGAKADDGKKPGAMAVTLVDGKAVAVRKLNRGRKVGVALAEGQNVARTLGNQPGNKINPPELARRAQRIARQYGLKCRVFDDRRLVQMGMGGILAVGSGSASKPRLIMLEYKGRRGSRSQAKRTPDAVVVGKAITFDSGGISIKPSANMEEMKYDKSGGCNVVGIMAAVAALKLPIDVVGLIPSAENLPSHTSYRPGDIVKTYSGKTVEVQNTDAEGRMILCDALAYAAKMKPKAIVDMATLTGACVVALGEHHAGLLGNDEGLQEALVQAGKATGERVWRLPSGAEYLEQMKSKVADLKNVGGRWGGTCTAAAFLGAFVGETTWAHIDIAGVADTTTEKSYRGVGATGFGVRLVLEYLRQLRK